MCKILNSPFNSDAIKRVKAVDAETSESDYICNGIDDHLQIQDALNTLPENGGTVVLSEGNFNLTAPLIMPEKSVRLLGQSMPFNWPYKQISKLNFKLPDPGNCVVFDDWHWAQALENINIIGDGTNTEVGIQVLSAFKTVRDVGIYNVTTCGLRGEEYSSQCIFENVYIRDLDCVAFQSFGAAMVFEACRATRNSVLPISELANGFDILDQGSIYMGCSAERYNHGFHVGNKAVGNTINGIHVERCNAGVYVGGEKEPRGISFFGGSIAACQGDGASVIIEKASGTTVSGLWIEGYQRELGIDISSEAVDTLIVGGWIGAKTKVKDDGIGTQII